MAARLILSMDGAVLKEYPLNKERMTIGRKEHNDIAIDNLAVSGEHAAIVTILHDSFLEDLDSTNGLEVNGKSTKKHFLQNNDVIEIGKYKLKYINDQITQTSSADFEKTMVLRAPVKQASPEAGKPAEPHGLQTQGGTKLAHVDAAVRTDKFETPKPTVVPPTVPPAAPQAVAPAKPAFSADASQSEASKQVAVLQVLTGPNEIGRASCRERV